MKSLPRSEAFRAQERHEEQDQQRSCNQGAERQIKAHECSNPGECADGGADQRERTDYEQDCDKIRHDALRVLEP